MTDFATGAVEANESAQVFCRALDAHDWSALSALVDEASLDDENGQAGRHELARSLAEIFGPGPSAQVSRTWLGVVAEPPDLAGLRRRHAYRCSRVEIPHEHSLRRPSSRLEAERLRVHLALGDRRSGDTPC